MCDSTSPAPAVTTAPTATEPIIPTAPTATPTPTTVAPTATPTPTASPTPQHGDQRLQVSKMDYLWIDAGEDGMVSAGDTLLYVIKVVNHSNTVVTNVSVRDPLAPMLTLLPGTLQSDHGTVVVGQETPAREVVVEMESLAPGVTATLSFQVRLPSAMLGGQLSNQAMVTLHDPAGQGGPFSIVSDDPETAVPFDATFTPLQGSVQVIYLPLVTR